MAKQSDSFAIYRIPEQSQIKFIQGNCLPQMQTVETLCASKHFVFSPFNKNNFAFAISADFEGTYDGNNNSFPDFCYSSHTHQNHSKDHYLNLVMEAIHQMKSTPDFHKVVLARTETFPTKILDPFELFVLLEQNFPAAFVYLVSTPQTGTWIGATPELLLEATPKRLKTVALAGTLPNTEGIHWGKKEIEEQHLVEIYIEAILHKQGFTYFKNGPHTLNSGQIRHLQTEYNIEVPENNYHQKISQLLNELNPTSAVGGMSKEKSIQFIQENEQINRSMYSGFVGLLEPNKQELFVNLRCMEIQSGSVTLFAGAGITVHSKPESEFIETTRKMNAIQQFLKPMK